MCVCVCVEMEAHEPECYVDSCQTMHGKRNHIHTHTHRFGVIDIRAYEHEFVWFG